MTTFDERERSYEAKFARDEELRFRAKARRDKAFGTWAAGRLGLAGQEAEDYARDVVNADLGRQGGDSVIVAKVMGDFQAKGLSATEAELARKLSELLGQAVADIEAGR